MEAALSATTFYLVSSPVAAKTMDPEPVGRAEEGEAVATSGAAAAAAFRESERQVGEAEAGTAQPPRCLVRQLPFWPAGLLPSRLPPGGAFRGSSSSTLASAWRKGPFTNPSSGSAADSGAASGF